MGAGADERLLEELEMTVVEDEVVGPGVTDVGESVLVVIVDVGKVEVLSGVVVDVDEGTVVVDVGRVDAGRVDVGRVGTGGVGVPSVVIVEVETSLIVGRVAVNVLGSVTDDALEGVIEALVVIVDVTSELVGAADVLDEVVIGSITDVALRLVLMLEGVVETLLVVVDCTAKLVEADVLEDKADVLDDRVDVLDEVVAGITTDVAPELELALVLDELVSGTTTDFVLEMELELERELDVFEEDDELEEEDEVEKDEEVLVELLFPFGPVLLLVVKAGKVEVPETV